MRRLARFLAAVDPAIALHISRYFPRHRSQIPATPVETVRHLAAVAREDLLYVYPGNC